MAPKAYSIGALESSQVRGNIFFVVRLSSQRSCAYNRTAWGVLRLSEDEEEPWHFRTFPTLTVRLP